MIEEIAGDQDQIGRIGLGDQRVERRGIEALRYLGELVSLYARDDKVKPVVDRAKSAGDLARAAAGADKALIAGVSVFDIYEGKGVPEGQKSVALEVTIQPRDKTLTDAEIEALTASVVAAVAKAGGTLRT